VYDDLENFRTQTLAALEIFRADRDSADREVEDSVQDLRDSLARMQKKTGQTPSKYEVLDKISDWVPVLKEVSDRAYRVVKRHLKRQAETRDADREAERALKGGLKVDSAIEDYVKASMQALMKHGQPAKPQVPKTPKTPKPVVPATPKPTTPGPRGPGGPQKVARYQPLVEGMEILKAKFPQATQDELYSCCKRNLLSIGKCLACKADSVIVNQRKACSAKCNRTALHNSFKAVLQALTAVTG
jgi:hypothetical protein